MQPAFSLFAGVLCAALCLSAQGSNPAITKAEGLPPRATPADYQAHAPAGPLTLAGEFTGHSVATPEGTLTTEDHVVVEAALFGPSGARTRLSFADFSLRINGKKPVPSEPGGLVYNSLKDPEREPPASAAKSSKTSIGSAGERDPGTPPEPVHIPIEVRRGWEQRVQKASLPEGDRALPQAGLLFFPYRGKTDKIQSLDLIYAGPAGKATLALQP